MRIAAKHAARPAIAFLLAAIAGAGCSGGSAPAPDAGKEIASAFLGELRGGRVDSAWAGTSAEFKSMLGMEGLRALVKKNPAMREPAEFVAMEAVERNGLKMAECTFRPEKRKAIIKVLLAREDGDWKVERLALE